MVSEVICAGISPLMIYTDFLVFARRYDHVPRKNDCFHTEYHKRRRTKYSGCKPSSNHISRNSGEVRSSHVYRGIVDQEDGRLDNCLKRSYAS
jgi:hypothetical protein